jgi:uncharacterized protein with ParB-like and HNH nuclease domain
MQVTNNSIYYVIKSIRANEIILPAFQREYVWKRRDIENLFDSLMQDFPINTMMFWRVSEITKENLEFYYFLDLNYQEGVSTNRPYDVVEHGSKIIVIDGQQRLTSLYLGIFGNYRTSKGKKPLHLYLCLDNQTSTVSNDDEESCINTEKMYNFKFLTDSNAKDLEKKGEHWIKVKDACDSDFSPALYLNQCGLATDSYASKTLEKLHWLFTKTDILNYYLVEKDRIEDVLEIFVRTNNGGRKLTKGDLLLSMITVNWASTNKDNARDYVQKILKDCVYKKVDKDWVLSCILYVLGKGSRLTVDNFDSGTSEDIHKKKNEIKRAIDAAFILVRRFGMHENGLSSKLAVIPIVYHIFCNKLADEIINAYHNGIERTYDKGEYEKMRTWLFRAIATNLFRASTNETLAKVSKIQTEFDKKKKGYFPYDEIVKELNLTISAEKIDDMLKTEKKVSFPLLNIIYSEHPYFLNSLKTNDDFDVDHIHPKTEFKNVEDNSYDTIPNLQLLNSRQNRSKNDLGLEKWWESIKLNGQKANYLFPDNFDPSPDAFNDFFSKRKEMLRGILEKKLGVTKTMSGKSDPNEIDNKHFDSKQENTDIFIRKCQSSQRLEINGLKDN